MYNLKPFVKGRPYNFEQEQKGGKRHQQGCNATVSKKLTVIARFNNV
jgi:hypothetical protein